jgi:hypothetical protein
MVIFLIFSTDNLLISNNIVHEFIKQHQISISIHRYMMNIDQKPLFLFND